MRRYIKDIFSGEYKWVDDEGGVEVYGEKQETRRAFQIIPDLEPYRSPIDDAVVSGRVQHRDHMRRHDVEELGNEKAKPHKRVEMPSAAQDLKTEMQRRGLIG